ncbi:hypothetical protein [Nocardia otitidiscaviarum]|uniref:hypothetical protein n=1 Tax=Nocardia otitidiscaviarum TaxID=1823 RepID=UPI0018951EEF|nr:hypothetical protein [Nocardia otitidiscaviarum]MBF6235803.1 hypothetical protein [Nocardia otitidiscaviarum]
MTQPLEVYTEQLRNAATATGTVQTKLDAVLTTLKAAINGRGEPWGDDEIGTNFADDANGQDGYRTTRDDYLSSLANMATTFESFSAGQTKAADYLEAQDKANGDQYR